MGKKLTIDFDREYRNLLRFRAPHAIQTYFGCTAQAAERVWERKQNTPKPEDLLNAVVNIGGRGSGKTRNGLYTLYRQLRDIPDNLGLVVRKQWTNMHISIIADFEEMLKELTGKPHEANNWKATCTACDEPSTCPGHPEVLVDGPHRREGYWEAKIYTSDPKRPSTLVFKQEPDVSSDRDVEDALKGPEYGIVLLDELTQLRKITFETLYDNLRRQNVRRPRLIGLSNPPVRGHWLYKLARESEQDQWEGNKPRVAVCRSHMDDNPFLPPDYKERLKAKYKNDPIKYAMYVEGRDGIEVEGTPVYKGAFNTQRNIAELKFHVGLPLIIGLDFGFRMNAAVFAQVVGRGHLNVLGELMVSQASLEAFGKMIKDYVAQRWHHDIFDSAEMYGDPNTLAQHGIQTGELTAAFIKEKWGKTPRYRKRSVELGIDTIRDLLTDYGLDGQRPRMMIDERYCPDLVGGFLAGYRWKESAGVIKPVPYKDQYYDHIMDACRYLTDNMFGAAGPMFRKGEGGPMIAAGMTPRRGRRES